MYKNPLPIQNFDSQIPDLRKVLRWRFEKNKQLTIDDLYDFLAIYKRKYLEAREVVKDMEANPCDLCEKHWIARLSCKNKVYQPLTSFYHDYRNLYLLVSMKKKDEQCFVRVAEYHLIKGDKVKLDHWIAKQKSFIFPFYSGWYGRFRERYLKYDDQLNPIGIQIFRDVHDLRLSTEEFSAILAYIHVLRPHDDYFFDEIERDND